jgi:hypothetical protein
MRFWFIVDSLQKARPDDFGRVLSVHSSESETQGEILNLKNNPEYRFFRVVEADYRQLDPNHFLMATQMNPIEAAVVEGPKETQQDIPLRHPMVLPEPVLKPPGCFLVASNHKNGKIHAVVDHLVYLGNGIRPTNTLLCTGYGFDESRYARQDDLQEVTCPRCLALLHYLAP